MQDRDGDTDRQCESQRRTEEIAQRGVPPSGPGIEGRADGPQLGAYLEENELVVIDAFSSDAIPLHLLTREAIGIYARAMKPDGILLIHISNRFFGLEPVLAAEAKARGWTAAIRIDPGPASGSDYDDLTASNWVALTATPQRMQQLTGGIRPRDQAFADGAWVPLAEDATVAASATGPRSARSLQPASAKALSAQSRVGSAHPRFLLFLLDGGHCPPDYLRRPLGFALPGPGRPRESSA